MAIIYGTVQDEGGDPIRGARVVLEHRPGGCDETWIERDQVFTHATGAYRSVFFLGSFLRLTSCFVVIVEPPAGTELQPSPPIPFEVDFHPGFPQDSVRVDVTLIPNHQPGRSP